MSIIQNQEWQSYLTKTLEQCVLLFYLAWSATTALVLYIHETMAARCYHASPLILLKSKILNKYLRVN